MPETGAAGCMAPLPMLGIGRTAPHRYSQAAQYRPNGGRANYAV
ncbi:hypothetical protein [Candidatus Poriferisodalis sp.]